MTADPEPYEVQWSPAARRALSEQLPEAIAAAVVELVLGALRIEPRRVGKPLHEPFDGHWSARRSTYRVIYTINEDKRLITIDVIRPRGTTYRPR
ncbi:MAG: plasmid stabilization system [Streptosporangiaceae bacterium]|nr:plasmid stabilization system [Streptosporangiaceae bacterium]